MFFKGPLILSFQKLKEVYNRHLYWLLLLGARASAERSSAAAQPVAALLIKLKEHFRSMFLK